MSVNTPGFVAAGYNSDILVPGPRADVSCGVAIGHKNAPLQMLVKEAQKAEKRAKTQYDRGAMAVSLYKRGGEIIEWGCKWELGRAFELLSCLSDYIDRDDHKGLSARFPYALARLLAPYKLETIKEKDATIRDLIEKEFAHVIKQQGLELDKLEQGKIDADKLQQLAKDYLSHLHEQAQYGDFIKLFLTETFINRVRGEE